MPEATRVEAVEAVETSSTDNSNHMSKNGVYYFNEVVTPSSIKPVIEFILNSALDPDQKLKYLTLIINSPGGHCTEGFGLIDIMLGSPIPIKTVGLGQIESMGLLIFMAGEKGHRLLTPNCMILSHQWSGWSMGKEHELVASQKRNTILSDMILRHYRRMTGLSNAKIKKLLLPPEDVWLTAKQAHLLGICDTVKDLKPILKR